ncbi:MAG: TonB family protein [Bacteroidetes bacterium]|jgi:TonB family protein|nr:TonB family protein [Bacteroidota bacterium]
MSTLQYILLANLFLTAFFGLYMLFLKKETFFQLNRVYLLSALLLSFILPLVHTNWFGQSAIAEQIKYSVIAKPIDVFASQQPGASSFTFLQIVSGVYIIGIIAFSLYLLIKLLAVKKIIFNSDSQSSYSFFKRIYLSESNSSNLLISKHESIHASQWHSVDVLLMEIVIIFNWFNPLVYLFRKELKNVHEFIADEGALKLSGSKKEYAMLLFSQTFETPINNLVNPFFNQKLLKQRIMMIQKDKSQKSALLKYLLAVPLFALMLTLSSATTARNETLNSSEKAALFPQQKDDKVFTEVEHVPNYPGGVEKFYQFLQQNIKYPAEAKSKKIQGKVFVSFIVEKDGSLSNLKAVKDPGAGCGPEAIRVMKLSPKWNPGIQNGHKVRVQYTLPIAFTLKA